MLRTIVPSIYVESPPQLIVQSNIIVNYLHGGNRRSNTTRKENMYNY